MPSYAESHPPRRSLLFPFVVLAALLGATMLLVACGKEAKAVADGDTVSVHYVGTLEDGEQFDSSREREQPLSFTVGSGQVIDGFNDAVRGLKVGDSVKVRLEPSDAYGEVDEQLIVEVPRSDAPADVRVGGVVSLPNGFSLRITEVTDEIVRLDGNHVLAGKVLNFEIEVISIEEPTETPAAQPQPTPQPQEAP